MGRGRIAYHASCCEPDSQDAVRNKEGFGYLFTSDTFQHGILTGYIQAFATNTTIGSAGSQILRWLSSTRQ
jgi:hypothetical protein